MFSCGLFIGIPYGSSFVPTGRDFIVCLAYFFDMFFMAAEMQIVWHYKCDVNLETRHDMKVVRNT
jgi:hypothetical protein